MVRGSNSVSAMIASPGQNKSPCIDSMNAPLEKFQENSCRNAFHKKALPQQHSEIIKQANRIAKIGATFSALKDAQKDETDRP